MSTSNKVLLHICCGVCAYACVETLRVKGFQVTGFFFNPNIHPEEEYQRRKEAVAQLAGVCNLDLRYGDYVADQWFEICQKHKDQAEGGYRCQVCFRFRLEETFNECVKGNYDFFATTLTVSPHKNSKIILEIGEMVGKEKFLALDFKKQRGFERTLAFAKSQNLYRQKYCGCVYSGVSPRH